MLERWNMGKAIARSSKLVANSSKMLKSINPHQNTKHLEPYALSLEPLRLWSMPLDDKCKAVTMDSLTEWWN